MSARRRDIRAERRAKELARWVGDGTPMPGDAPEREPDPWDWPEPPSEKRIPIGPLDVAGTTRNSERHA